MPKAKSQKKPDEFKNIQKSLISALEIKGTPAPFVLDQVDEYMMYWQMRKQLEKAVGKTKAITKYDNGGGQKGIKVNDALKELPKITKTMANILESLKLSGVIDDETTDGL
ncbi:hypothetical protein LABALGNA3A7_09680 [Dellaglioa algida]|nr:hypothetical protein LABALGNA3A7_09680 [Dellaglioa algida]